MPKFSIVVPAYNVESYISECLDSLLNQTFDDFEVVCVDDAWVGVAACQASVQNAGGPPCDQGGAGDTWAQPRRPRRC